MKAYEFRNNLIDYVLESEGSANGFLAQYISRWFSENTKDQEELTAQALAQLLAEAFEDLINASTEHALGARNLIFAAFRTRRIGHLLDIQGYDRQGIPRSLNFILDIAIAAPELKRGVMAYLQAQETVLVQEFYQFLREVYRGQLAESINTSEWYEYTLAGTTTNVRFHPSIGEIRVTFKNKNDPNLNMTFDGNRGDYRGTSFTLYAANCTFEQAREMINDARESKRRLTELGAAGASTPT